MDHSVFITQSVQKQHVLRSTLTILGFFILNSIPTSGRSLLAAYDPPWWPSLPQVVDIFPPADSDCLAPVPYKVKPIGGCLCCGTPGQWFTCFGGSNCTTIPQLHNNTVKVLRIKTTDIQSIRKDDMAKLTQLESLKIEGNHNLVDIEPGAFSNMIELTNFSLSFNSRLRYLKENVFEGLINLRELNLLKNDFTSVAEVTPALSPKYLPSLIKLGLSENFFTDINEHDFEPMNGTRVTELNLILCQTEYMHQKSLRPFKKLKALRIGENNLNASMVTELVNQLMDDEIPLGLLNLYGLGFRKRPPMELLEAVAKSNITHLILAKNQFEYLVPLTFPPMPRLQFLDLREVLALVVEPRALGVIRMPNLRVLLLGGNKLAGVSDGVLLHQLQALDLSDNSGNHFFPSYFHLGNYSFLNMTRLMTLNLSFNRINGIFNGTFVGLDNLKILGLKNSSLLHIENGAFAPLQKLELLNLENNPFPSFFGLKGQIFYGLTQLKVLLLSGCSIQKLSNNSFMYLTNLMHLGLENNELVTLSPDYFSPLVNLRSIDISYNRLESWNQSIFKSNPSLDQVTVNANKFTRFTKEMTEDFQHLSKVDIRDNQISCDCESLVHLIRLVVLEKSSNFSLILNVCADTIEELIQNKVGIAKFNVTTAEDKLLLMCEVGFVTPNIYLFLIPLILLFVLIIGIIGMTYKYRWYLRYWIFLARISLEKRKKSNKVLPITTYKYDAFVSYSNEDRNFVVRLVAMLENFEPYLKLCVYERDFEIGSVITEAVLDHLAASRTTILIISDAFAKSQWCRWETQLAENHRLFMNEGTDEPLIMIRLGAVANCHLTPTLKYLLKTRIYLQWDPDPKKQKIFWDKLRSNLSINKIKTKCFDSDNGSEKSDNNLEIRQKIDNSLENENLVIVQHSSIVSDDNNCESC